MALSFEDYFKNFRKQSVVENQNGKSYRYEHILEIFDNANRRALENSLVFCFSNNDIGGVMGYLALLASKSLIFMLDPQIDEHSFQNLMEKYAPHFIWVSKNFLNFIDTNYEICVEFEGYILIKLPSTQAAIDNNIRLLLSTSGSTGSPKAVKLTEKNLVANGLAIVQYLNLTQNEVPITSLPLNYSFGLSVINSHVLVGAKIAVSEHSLLKKEFWEFIGKIGVTSFAGVPYHYELLKKLDFFGKRLPKLSTLTQAGGRLSPDLQQEFAKNCNSSGRRFFIMYGQTEAAPRISYLPHDLASKKIGCVGAAVPGGKLWLENSEGQVIDDIDVEGELVYQGDNVFAGYATSRADLSSCDEKNRTLRTGDIAKRDVDGHYYITGRIQRFLKMFGRRINLADIENFSEANGFFCVCGGHEDNLIVYVEKILPEGARSLKKLIAKFLKIHLKSVLIAEIESFPKKKSGKLDFKSLKSVNILHKY